MVNALRLCPNCDRPSPNQYRSCMYCGASLPAAHGDDGEEADAVAVPAPSSEQDSSPALAPVQSTVDSPEFERLRAGLLSALSRSRGPFGPRQAPYRLVLLPAVGNREGAHWLMHRLADRVGIDLYTARSHLNRLVPSFLTESADRQALEGVAMSLREAGLVVTIIASDSWLQSALPTPVIGVACDEGGSHCTFVAGDGDSLRVDRATLAWACMAHIEPRRSQGAGEVGDDGSATLSVPSLSRNAGSFQLLDIMRSDCRSALRLRADCFDFSCLGDERSISAEQNLRSLLRWLSPDPERIIPLDECFKRVPSVATDKMGDGLLGAAGGALLAREVEFTEYALILDRLRRELEDLV